MGKEDYRIYKELLDGRLLASSTELVVRHPSGRDDAHARALASWCLLPLLQREAVAAAARGGSPRLQLAEPLRLFLISSPQTHSAAACLAEVEQEAKALQQQLPELQVEVLGSKGAGGDASVDASALVYCKAGGKAELCLCHRQGDRHACIQLTAKVKIIRLGHERHRPLAVKGMTVSAAAGSKPRFTLQLGGPLGSALTRVTARLAGFDDKRLDKQRKTVEVSQARRAATFEAPRGMSSQELQSIAAAVRTGRLQPVVHSWLEKVPEPAAGAVVLELRPSEAEVSVRNADGQAVQITAAAAEEARQQLWARLAQLPLPARLSQPGPPCSSATQGGLADLACRVDNLEVRNEAADVMAEGLAEGTDAHLSVVERVLLVHGQQLHQHSTELARLSRALAAQLSHGRHMSQQAQRVQHGDAEMAEASRKRVRSSEQHNLQQNEEPPPSPTVLPIPLQQEHPGRQQEPQGGAASLQAEPRWQRGQQEEQLARLTSTLRYLHISRELAQQTQAMRSCSSVEILAASGSAAYMQPTALKQSLGRAAAAIAARHGGLQPSSPLQLDAAVLPCIVRAVLTEHCQTAAAARRDAAAQCPVDFWLTAEQLCRRVCERSKAALPSLLLLHEQPFQEQAAIRKKITSLVCHLSKQPKSSVERSMRGDKVLFRLVLSGTGGQGQAASDEGASTGHAGATTS